MVEVKILGCVMTAQYGVLSTGNILRTSAEFAAHLVNDCAAAEYTQAMEPAAEDPPLPEIEAEVPAEPALEIEAVKPKPKK